MATGDRKDPFRGFKFRVEIDGIQRAGFREASGLDASQDPIDYREGDDKTMTIRKLPGLKKFSNIVLKRGITRDTALWQWRKSIVDGTLDRRNGTIVMLDETHTPVLRWSFRRGWPCKWEGPCLDAGSNEVAIETLEIAHEGLELEVA